MATLMRQTNRTPQFLFNTPRPTGRKTVSGAEIYEPDWFVVEAAGGHDPEHAGETRAERDARLERYTTYGLAVAILLAVGVAIGLAVL